METERTGSSQSHSQSDFKHTHTHTHKCTHYWAPKGLSPNKHAYTFNWCGI